VAKINALVDGNRVFSDCFRNFYLSNENSLQNLIFLIPCVLAMLKNIVIALGGKMIIWIQYWVVWG